MGQIGKITEAKVEELVPYARNARQHEDSQIDLIANSIREFGFLNPVLIDKDKNVIAGHGRILAAKKIGMEKVPVLYVEGLTEEQRRAYILADNRLTELGSWDTGIVLSELQELQDLDFDVALTGFEVPETAGDFSLWNENREKNDDSRQEGNDEYNEWLDKFEVKKTTDDCYTPELVYDAIADFVAKEYKVERASFVRPFYPGGDYQNERYAKGAVVVDNPPFSILAEILRFYAEKGIRFFLFAPSLTLFSCAELDLCYIAADGDITYENGATVNTSFITNLDDRYMIRTAPALTEAICEANKVNRAEITKPINLKYKYPPEVITAAMVGNWARVGVDFRIPKKSGVRIAALDAQKQFDKAIDGGGVPLKRQGESRSGQGESPGGSESPGGGERNDRDRRKNRRNNLATFGTGKGDH